VAGFSFFSTLGRNAVAIRAVTTLGYFAAMPIRKPIRKLDSNKSWEYSPARIGDHADA
jgi:hypothetical protein